MKLFKLFDYSDFIKELKNNNEKRECVEMYSKYYGSQDDINIEDTPFYKDYLSKFEVPFNVATPEELEDDFDWDLLIKLVAGSFSSKYDLLLDEGSQETIPKVHLYITVRSRDQKVTKDIFELCSFQIIKLFNIYIEEQMNLFSLKAEDKEEVTAILEEQNMRLAKFKKKVFPIMNQFNYNNEIENLL